MAKRVNRINVWAGKEDFVLYDPYQHVIKHLGETHIRLNMEFNKEGMACIFESVGCAPKIPSKRRKGPVGSLEKS